MKRECDLYPPVRDWLQRHGYEIHVEIFDADIVAVRDGKLTVVELKPHLTSELVRQCRDRCQWADFVIAAVGCTPRSFSIQRHSFNHNGIGLMLVRADGAMLKRKPKPQPWQWHRKHDYRVKRLAGRAPAMAHELAGVPSCALLRQQRQARLEH